MNILVTSAGAASGINVIKSLRIQQEFGVNIIAADADPTAPGLYLADRGVVVPRYLDNDYANALLQLCEEHQVRAVYPTHSTEIEVMAERASAFGQHGIGLLLPPVEAVRLCNDKRRMYALAASLDIPTPRLFTGDGDLSFPLFAKPNSASGARSAGRIDDEVDLAYAKGKHPDFVFQDFIAGSEYTVDVLCDRDADLIVASPRLRLATKAGQCVKGRTVNEPVLVELCAKLCKAAGVVGPCNLQFIKGEFGFVFIELNPRYAAGGLMLTVQAGANLPLLALKLMLGVKVTPPTVQPGVVMLRYWQEMFLDEEPETPADCAGSRPFARRCQSRTLAESIP